MESAFTVLAEPNRRAILMLLATERSVGDLESEFDLSQPSVFKHRRVLREGKGGGKRLTLWRHIDCRHTTKHFGMGA